MLNFESGRWPSYGLSRHGIFVEHVKWLDGLREFCATHSGQPKNFTSAPALNNWLPAGLTTNATTGNGRPQMHWQPTTNGATKLAGHNADYLLCRLPLRGDYQVECDISTGVWMNGQLMVAGTYVAAGSDRSKLFTANFSEVRTSRPLDRPLSQAKRWTHYRAVVRGQRLTVYLNGREVQSRDLPADYHPWIGVHCWNRSRCEIQNLRITGSPTIPHSVALIADESLNGWAPYYAEESVDTTWQSVATADGLIVNSAQRLELANTVAERILKYQRPMIEDGSIEYEFFYQPGVVEVHPALGRLCFLLSPNGVKHHWHTDGAAERSARDPDNLLAQLGNAAAIDESAVTLAASLKPNDWNRLKLQLKGDTVHLFLNKQAVHQHTLLDPNNRTFGLFHFVDQTSARFRNVVWRGNWPTTLPPLQEQQLRNPIYEELDAARTQLPAEVYHDFSTGLATDALKLFGQESATTQFEDGLQLNTTGWRIGVDKVGLTFGLQGDFDLEVQMRDLLTVYDNGKKAGFGLRIYFEGPMKDFYAAYRRVQNPGGQERAAFAERIHRPDGKSWFRTDSIPEESTSGRLRITRRGKIMSALFAEDDSPNFRLIDRREVTDAATRPDGIELLMWCQGNGKSQVVLQNLSLRAEKFVRPVAPPDLLTE